jgi:hypothetical protein
MSPSLKEIMNLAIFAFLAPSLAKNKIPAAGMRIAGPK